MFWKNLFSSDEQPKEAAKDSSDTLERAKLFFEKMEQRAKELVAEVKESGQLIADADQDPYKRSYLQFKSAIIAQFTGMIDKGTQTYHSQILPKANFATMLPLSQLYTAWQTNLLKMMEDSFEGIQERNLEKEYQEIMAGYNQTKDGFQCKQCGADLAINKFYYTATYITCGFCQSQNMFDPGSQARLVEHMAIPLARARSKDQYEQYRQKKEAVGQKAATPEYELYAQAIKKEMDEILPGNEAQNQNFYDRLLKDFHNFHVAW